MQDVYSFDESSEQFKMRDRVLFVVLTTQILCSAICLGFSLYIEHSLGTAGSVASFIVAGVACVLLLRSRNESTVRIALKTRRRRRMAVRAVYACAIGLFIYVILLIAVRFLCTRSTHSLSYPSGCETTSPVSFSGTCDSSEGCTTFQHFVYAILLLHGYTVFFVVDTIIALCRIASELELVPGATTA
jgi:hypothetical protein